MPYGGCYCLPTTLNFIDDDGSKIGFSLSSTSKEPIIKKYFPLIFSYCLIVVVWVLMLVQTNWFYTFFIALSYWSNGQLISRQRNELQEKILYLRRKKGSEYENMGVTNKQTWKKGTQIWSKLRRVNWHRGGIRHGKNTSSPYWNCDLPWSWRCSSVWNWYSHLQKSGLNMCSRHSQQIIQRFLSKYLFLSWSIRTLWVESIRSWRFWGSWIIPINWIMAT